MFGKRSPRLPPELCDMIIHILADDKKTLRACSLTCKAFLPASRSNLFHHVRLNDFRVAKRFFDNICATNSSTNPSTYVRRLIIEGSRSEYPFQVKPWTEITFANLALITVHLVEVTALELRYLQLDMLDRGGAWKAIFSSLRKVDYLRMQYVRASTPEDVNRYIATFPALTTVSSAVTSGPRWTQSNTPLTVPLPRGLRNITIHGFDTFLFHRLLSHESHPDVHTLNFVSLLWRFIEPAAILLKTMGSSLEHLHLGGLNVGDPGKLVGRILAYVSGLSV
jgi:hypothetical protein